MIRPLASPDQMLRVVETVFQSFCQLKTLWIKIKVCRAADTDGSSNETYEVQTGLIYEYFHCGVQGRHRPRPTLQVDVIGDC